MRYKVLNFAWVIVLSQLMATISLSARIAPQDATPKSSSPQGGETTTIARTELEKEIETAKITATELRNVYVEAQRLAKTGSVSPRELRRSNYEYKLAMLKVIELENPSKAREIALAQAQLELDLLTKELDVTASLYKRGAKSELEYQRARAAFDVAKFSLQAVQDGQGEKLFGIKSAQAKLKLATEVFQKANRLVRVNSISETVFEQAKTNLQNAEDELELARKELGILVRQVPPIDGANR